VFVRAYVCTCLRTRVCIHMCIYIIFTQAHREVFEHLMEDFKTYKPLLSAIKNEYDLYISYLQLQIAELEPLKVMVTF